QKATRLGQTEAVGSPLALGVTEVAGVGGAEQEDREREIDDDVGEEPQARPQEQHHPTADRGAEQDRQVAACGVESNRARQALRGHSGPRRAGLARRSTHWRDYSPWLRRSGGGTA